MYDKAKFLLAFNLHKNNNLAACEGSLIKFNILKTGKVLSIG